MERKITAYSTFSLTPVSQLMLGGLIELLLSGCNRQLKPFANDGCSAFPDGTITENQFWLSCCEQHDFSYWQGGSYSAKIQADDALEACVAKIGNPEVAKRMLAGVCSRGLGLFTHYFSMGLWLALSKIL